MHIVRSEPGVQADSSAFTWLCPGEGPCAMRDGPLCRSRRAAPSSRSLSVPCVAPPESVRAPLALPLGERAVARSEHTATCRKCSAVVYAGRDLVSAVAATRGRGFTDFVNVLRKTRMWACCALLAPLFRRVRAPAAVRCVWLAHGSGYAVAGGCCSEWRRAHAAAVRRGVVVRSA